MASFNAAGAGAANPNPNKSVEVTPAPGDSVSSLSFSPKANHLVATSWDNQVRCWEVLPGGGCQAKASISHDQPVLCSAWKDDGMTVFSGGCDKQVKMWQLLSGGQPTAFTGHEAPIKELAWVPQMNLLVSGSWDKTLRYWDIRQPQPVHVQQLPERCYALSLCYPLMVVGTADRNIIVFNLQNPQAEFKRITSPLKLQTRCPGSEGRSVRREVAVNQPKAKEASTDKSSVKLDQMSRKGSQTNTDVKGILPGNFFDYGEEDEAPAPEELSTSGNVASSNHTKVKGVPDGFFDNNKTGNGMQPSEPGSLSKEAKSSETAQVKGSLPEGFFDNKDADLRARGIQPQKVDMNDAYKEFEKEIQEDLQEVDDRLEEEEIDAAAEREEYLTLEQQEYRQKVDMLKKQLIESKAARTAKVNSKPVGMGTESSSDSSSDEEDDITDFAVDWRAQHLK